MCSSFAEEKGNSKGGKLGRFGKQQLCFSRCENLLLEAEEQHCDTNRLTMTTAKSLFIARKLRKAYFDIFLN